MGFRGKWGKMKQFRAIRPSPTAIFSADMQKSVDINFNNDERFLLLSYIFYYLRQNLMTHHPSSTQHIDWDVTLILVYLMQCLPFT